MQIRSHLHNRNIRRSECFKAIVVNTEVNVKYFLQAYIQPIIDSETKSGFICFNLFFASLNPDCIRYQFSSGLL